MPFNGSGTFQRVYNWVTDKNNSINITASRMDTEDTGFATGLSLCLTKDGQQIPTANLPMGGFAHTGVALATLATQYARVDQVQSQAFSWIAGGGTADAITATYAPALTSLTDGLVVKFRATAANTTTAPTFAPNGLTAHTITKLGGAALIAGDISAALAEYEIVYNLANTRWELMNPAVKSGASANNLVRLDSNAKLPAVDGSQLTNLPSGGGTLLATQTASNSATVDFTANIDSTYKHYIIEITNLTTGGSGTLWARFYQGGAFISSSNYSYSFTEVGSSGSPGSANANAQAQIILGTAVPAAGNQAAYIIDLYRPDIAQPMVISWRGVEGDNTPRVWAVNGAGQLNTSTATTGIRFLQASGNIGTGTFKLYGVS